jgi:muramidase (phage lysozyme)
MTNMLKHQFTQASGKLSIALILTCVVSLHSASSLATSTAVTPAPSDARGVTFTTAMAVTSVPTIARVQMPTVTRKYKHPSMHGYRKSVYTGKFYNKSQEHFRECVMYLESRNTYGSNNYPTSTAAGAYQFLDRSWRDGLTHMIYPELKKDYGKPVAKKIRTKLQKTPINKWSREMQDRAFFTALNYEGKWSGQDHWNETVPGRTCNL